MIGQMLNRFRKIDCYLSVICIIYSYLLFVLVFGYELYNFSIFYAVIGVCTFIYMVLLTYDLIDPLLYRLLIKIFRNKNSQEVVLDSIEGPHRDLQEILTKMDHLDAACSKKDSPSQPEGNAETFRTALDHHELAEFVVCRDATAFLVEEFGKKYGKYTLNSIYHIAYLTLVNIPDEQYPAWMIIDFNDFNVTYSDYKNNETLHDFLKRKRPYTYILKS